MPEITLYEKNVMVAAGDPAIMKCSATGIPKPKITWYKGDVEVSFYGDSPNPQSHGTKVM